jgi:uncharacterized iron-regulated protein
MKTRRRSRRASSVRGAGAVRDRRPRRPSAARRLALAAALAAGACAGGPERARGDGAALPAAGDHALIDAASGRALTLDEAADALALHDVVFLGEEHDNDVGHRVQLALTEALLERRGEVIVSLEQFERDAQAALDAYLAGESDEETFLAAAHPWPNYAEHYRPVIELARERGLRVVAGNVPRRLAARVVEAGPRRVLASPWTPRATLTPPGEYRERFFDVMGDHAGGDDADVRMRVFAAQCLKDDAMAEAIADALAESPGTLVVHWCGRFHSDAHLGTVERLAWRRPDLSIGVVTMNSGGRLDRPLSDRERADGDVVLRVPEQPDEE